MYPISRAIARNDAPNKPSRAMTRMAASTISAYRTKRFGEANRQARRPSGPERVTSPWNERTLRRFVDRAGFNSLFHVGIQWSPCLTNALYRSIKHNNCYYVIYCRGCRGRGAYDSPRVPGGGARNRRDRRAVRWQRRMKMLVTEQMKRE